VSLKKVEVTVLRRFGCKISKASLLPLPHHPLSPYKRGTYIFEGGLEEHHLVEGC
jgi:hypothetical protein